MTTILFLVALLLQACASCLPDEQGARLSLAVHRPLRAGVVLQPPDQAPPRKKVFLVEDASDARAALTALIDVHGFGLAGTASTEYAATDWLSNHNGDWDLAIVDLLLLDGSGFNVLQRFAAAPSRGKVVVYSGYVTDAIRDRCLKLGADAVFLKTDIPQLVAYLETLSAA